MGTIRTATLSRHSAPNFLIMGGLELMQLRKLSWLARGLFVELLAMADHSTGLISTSYAVLAALMDFDAAPGAHKTDTPSVQRLRTALADLVSLRLVTVDRISNEKRKGLFLRVQSRVGISASGEMSNRRSNRPVRAKRPAKSKDCDSTKVQEQQTEQQGVQEKIFTPSPQLSTVQAEARERLRHISDAIKTRSAGTP